MHYSLYSMLLYLRPSVEVEAGLFCMHYLHYSLYSQYSVLEYLLPGLEVEEVCVAPAGITRLTRFARFTRST